MRKTVLAGSVLTALIVSSAAAAAPASAAEVDPAVADRVVIDIVAVAGCPAGTAMVEVSPDNTSFRLWFSALQVQIGPHTSPADARRTCQVALGIHVPAGHTYAIDRIQYGGYASLAAGAVFTQRARHYRSGQVVDQPFRSHSWTGPMADEWQAVDILTADELYFPLPPPDQALLTPAPARCPAEPSPSRLAAGFKIGVTTAWRHVQEATLAVT